MEMGEERGDSPVMVAGPGWNRADRLAEPSGPDRGTYRPPPTPTRWRDANASNASPFSLALVTLGFPDLERDFHFRIH